MVLGEAGILAFLIFFSDRMEKNKIKIEKKQISILVFALFFCYFFAKSFREGLLFSHDHVSRIYLSRNILSLIACQIILMSVLFRSKVVEVLKEYFSAKSHPLNLAIFRIFIFFSIWQSSFSSGPVFFSGLPKELLYPHSYGCRYAR